MSLTTVDGSLISSGAITLTTQVTGTLPEANGGTGTTVGYCGFKNKIINGAMVIDQRNAGASVTASTTGNEIYTLDRWSYYASAASKFTIQQNAGAVTPPVGFSTYLGVTSSSAYSISASDWFTVKQSIEGFNTSDLAWGTVNAKTVTISFQVYSSLTGTFGGSLRNSVASRSYPFSYSIPVANTWTTISITIAGDTSGTWLTTNGTGIQIFWGLGVGSSNSGTAGAWAAAGYGSATGATSVVGTSGATFYITGVQLEKGSTATSFDYRPYGTELALCQRYYQLLQNTQGGRAETTLLLSLPFSTLCTMRSAPSAATVGTIVFRDVTGTTTRTATTPSAPSLSLANPTGGYLEISASSFSPSNFTIGNLLALVCSTGLNGIALSAEL